MPPAAADNNTTLSWTDWSLLCAAASSYAGKLTDAELTAFTPFSYPSLSVTEFEGDGTMTSPYLIKTLDHLILLADQVNNDTEYVGTYYNSQYTRTYIGKYFALANDIDMSGYRFEPIGSTCRSVSPESWMVADTRSPVLPSTELLNSMQACSAWPIPHVC